MSTTRPAPGARRVLFVIVVSTVMMSLSSNMLNIAVPALSAHFSASSTDASMVVIAYQLVNAALLVPAGQVADALDRRKVFAAGLAGFTAATLLLGFSPSIQAVVIGRAVQGAAAALLMSNAVSILATVYPGRHLTGAMGIYLAGFSVGQVAGPLTGGLIVSAWGWQWIFWALVPVALVALVAGLWSLRAVPVDAPRPLHLDIPGGLLLGAILCGVQLAFSASAETGLSDPRILGVFAACALAVPVLALIERRVRHPALDPVLFRNRAFPWALTEGFLVTLPRYAAMTVAGLHFQGVQGDSAAVAALKIFTFPIGLSIGSLIGDRIGRLTGPDLGRTLGALVATIGMLALVLGIWWWPTPLTLTGLGFFGFGIGLHQALQSSAILESAPRERTGVVNAIRVMSQTFGSGVGLAAGMALTVGFAPSAVARTFLAGDAAGLGADRILIDQGYAVTYGLFGILLLAGTLMSLRRFPRATHERP